MCIHASLSETNAPATCLLWNYFLLWILTDWCVLQAKTDAAPQTSVSSGHLHVHPFTFNWWTTPQPGFTASLNASTRENHSRSSPLCNPNERTDGKRRREMKRRRRSLYLSSPAERRIAAGGELIYDPPKEKEWKLIKQSWRRVCTGGRRVMEGGAGGAERVSEQISCDSFWHQWTAAFLIHSALNNLTVSHATLQTRAGHMAENHFLTNSGYQFWFIFIILCHLTSQFIYNMIQATFSVLTI